MNNIILTFLSLLFVTNSNGYDKNKEYNLNTISEEYNTLYFFTENFRQPVFMDVIHYIDATLPSSFVVEIGALKEGEQSVIVYDDTKEILLEKKERKYRINGKIIDHFDCRYKISLYFVNNKVIAYFDEIKIIELNLKFDSKKKIGIKWSKDGRYSYTFLNCFEPVPFKTANYGKILDDGVFSKNKGVRMYQHNVGEKYSLTFPNDIVHNSSRSMRFEYRYENSRAEGINKMRRGRSEISGVYCNSPMNKWIIEYDLYIPSITIDDPNNSEVITQIHEGSETPTSPSFVISMIDGKIRCMTRGDSILISEWKGKKLHHHRNESEQLSLSKNQWHHVKIYIKEGYQFNTMPLTKVWVDGKLLYDNHYPNCYRYTPKNSLYYDYIKFGIYKSSWLRQEESNSEIWNRIYYFDNYTVKY